VQLPAAETPDGEGGESRGPGEALLASRLDARREDRLGEGRELARGLVEVRQPRDVPQPDPEHLPTA